MIQIKKVTHDIQQKSSLLKPLNQAVLALLGVALILTFIRQSTWYSILAVVVSIILNVAVFTFNQQQKTIISTHLFCFWINLGLLFFGLSNVMVNNLGLAITFFYTLALSVMLGGMLISIRYSFLVGTIDSIIIAGIIFYYQFTINYPTEEMGSIIGNTTGIVFPITGFLFMIAIISWLYQRELQFSAQRLEAARQKVLEGELLRRDLAVARELQQRLYPPPILTNSVFSIASRSEPARETSGDFYDFIKLDAHRLGIVVADVTGKSIAAALVMAMARSTVRSEATRHTRPSEVLHYANQTLCHDNTFKEMITAFYGVLDTRNLSFTFANAGHPYPVLRRNGQLQEMEIGGLPLGSHPIALYSEQSIELQPGDQIILVSDGLYEEMNSEREMFGFPRMMESIQRANPNDPHIALSEIWEQIEVFRGAIEQSDDITLMVIQVTARHTQSHEP